MENKTTRISGSSVKTPATIGHRTVSEVEGLYKFVHENGLREETKLIFESLMAIISPKKAAKRKKAASKARAKAKSKKKLH